MDNTANLAGSQSVLVVDDDEFSVENFCLKLRRLGLTRITVARNGVEAVQALKQAQAAPDFLICDIFMPDMDGIEFVSVLAERKYKGGLLLVSGGARALLEAAQAIAVGMELNVLGAYAKPLPLPVLAHALGLAVTGDRSP